MSVVLGIDTSNYTTSVAVYDSTTNQIVQRKKLLPVKKGEKGIRQSDAVFHHTVQLPQLLEELFFEVGKQKIDAVSVSTTPRRQEGSYMPCFLVGTSAATAVSVSNGIPLIRLSHQEGHIVAALYSANRLDLLKTTFLAFHVSGGTTEALLVTPHSKHIFNVEIVANSLDLKAGQAIDRVGVMLGLNFPAGPKLEELSKHGILPQKIKTSMKACNCSLSGIENKCKSFFNAGESAENIALFCIDSVKMALDNMLEQLLLKYGNLPIVFSGGVTSNQRIRQYFEEKYNAVFAEPVYSADNAAGIAVLGAIKNEMMK